MTWKDFPRKKEFEGLVPGSSAFDSQWNDFAAAQPEEFAELQKRFIFEKHYKPVANGLLKDGIDADKHSNALQQVLWSTGVQHGPGTNVVRKAVQRLKNEGRFDPSGKDFDAELIDAIYEERKKDFPSSSVETQKNISSRFDSEKRDALHALTNEKGGE